ncbi:hypothetical protein PMAYCL1PPCAC_20254, partial [Pristionchus mayeri]
TTRVAFPIGCHASDSNFSPANSLRFLRLSYHCLHLFAMSNALLDGRTHLQGLCAIATLSILLGALAPASFSNGFLGVDTYFVLAGYFIASVLSLESLIDCKIIKTFYARCFQCIVPLYSAILLILTVS